MIKIDNLELHVAHGCNLACESCSHYSNHNHKGLASREEAGAWMADWSRRVKPAQFSLLGGEPAIHPELALFVPLVRAHWPRARIRIATNGLLLDRHPDLPAAMARAGRSVLEVSIHHLSEPYIARLRPVFDLLRAWVRAHGIRVRLIHAYRDWTRRYLGFGAAMAPFHDENPRESWQNCPARCHQLYRGGIWKCAPLAYLGMQDERYGLSEAWRPYLGYRPLAADCSDAELLEFFRREEESHCAMCSSNPQRFDLPLPIPGRPAAVPMPAL